MYKHITDRSDVIDLLSTEPMLLHVPFPSHPCLVVVSFIYLVRFPLTVFHLCCHRGRSQDGESSQI